MDKSPHSTQSSRVGCGGHGDSSIVNLLWLTAGLTGVLVTPHQLAERKSEDFFRRRGVESAANFLRQYHRLNGIVLRQSGGDFLRLNPQSPHKAPPENVTTLQRLYII